MKGYGFTVWYPGKGKTFFPDGREYLRRDFKNALYERIGTIRHAKRMLQKYGLSHKVKLGKIHLHSVKNFNCLYRQGIHPGFLAEALDTIVNCVDLLKPRVKQILLRNLRRENIGQALKHGKIREADLGRDFENFGFRMDREKLEILKKLGVLLLEDRASLPTKEELFRPPPELEPPPAVDSEFPPSATESPKARERQLTLQSYTLRVGLRERPARRPAKQALGTKATGKEGKTSEVKKGQQDLFPD